MRRTASVTALVSSSPQRGRNDHCAIARHRNPDTRKAHESMGFYDGWGTVVTQLETYARGLMR